MQINIRFFALLREQLGCEHIEFDYQGEPTIAALRHTLATRGDAWLAIINGNTLAAINHTLCQDHAIISDGDEVAFFPPVTGG